MRMIGEPKSVLYYNGMSVDIVDLNQVHLLVLITIQAAFAEERQTDEMFDSRTMERERYNSSGHNRAILLSTPVSSHQLTVENKLL